MFKSRIDSQISQFVPAKNMQHKTLKGMAKKITQKLSELRSQFLYKASHMQMQSKINFKRKKTNISEIGFSKARAPKEAFDKDMHQKSAFLRKQDRNADQSSRIYSVDSIKEEETHVSLRKMNKQKTEEIMKKIENLESPPNAHKHTDDGASKSSDKVLYGNFGVFSGIKHKRSKKLNPIVMSDDFDDPFLK